MSVVLKEYGHTADGTPVQLAILNNGQIEVHILSYAAAIQKLFVPDSKGRKVDVVLGFDDVAGYEANGGSLGSVVGRFANRIAGAHFVIDNFAQPADFAQLRYGHRVILRRAEG